MGNLAKGFDLYIFPPGDLEALECGPRLVDECAKCFALKLIAFLHVNVLKLAHAGKHFSDGFIGQVSKMSKRERSERCAVFSNGGENLVGKLGAGQVQMDKGWADGFEKIRDSLIAECRTG